MMEDELVIVPDSQRMSQLMGQNDPERRLAVILVNLDPLVAALPGIAALFKLGARRAKGAGFRIGLAQQPLCLVTSTLMSSARRFSSCFPGFQPRRLFLQGLPLAVQAAVFASGAPPALFTCLTTAL